MRYSINLATRIYLDHRLLNRFGYGIIVILFMLLVWNVSRFSSNMGEMSHLRAEIGVIESKLTARQSGITEADYSRQKSSIRFYNGIIERKSVDWLNLLALFENATPEGIALSSLIPGKEPKEWKLEGRAHSFKTVQLYLEKLEESKTFSNILLLSHKNMTAADKGRGVQFTISCTVLM